LSADRQDEYKLRIAPEFIRVLRKEKHTLNRLSGLYSRGVEKYYFTIISYGAILKNKIKSLSNLLNIK
jgi:hypothetical protein